MTAIAPAAPRPARMGRTRGGWLTTGLVLPAAAWYLILLVIPLAIVLIFSFGERGATGGGGTLGDLPPGHPADRPPRADHRQHPRVHPDDGRVRHPADPWLRAGLHDGQRPRAALPRGAQLAGRFGLRRGPDPRDARHDHGLPV